MKKYSLVLIFGLIITTATPYMHALNHDDLDDDIFAVDTELSALSFNRNSDFLENSTRTPTNSDQFIQLFFNIMQGLNPAYPADVLNTPIYQRTNLLRNRSILEYPFTLTYGFHTKDQQTISLQVFANWTAPKNYTQSGTTLNTYFDLANTQRFAALKAVDDYFGLDTIQGVASSLALLDPATVEERRLGGIIATQILRNNWNFIAQLPVLYTERNLQLKPWEKAAIYTSKLGSMLQTDNISEHDFVYEHLVMDQFGFGDLKGKFTYALHTTDTFNLDLGAFVILPTAKALKKGMVGVWFNQNNDRGYLNLGGIDPMNLSTQNQDDIANFFESAMDKLSSNILHAPLGNGGFVSIAPTLNFDWYFAHNWQFSNDFSVQIPLPTMQPRYYQYVQTQEQFQAAFDQAFNSDAQTFTLFVNQELQNLFFPYEFLTRVYPGFVFNNSNQFLYQFRTWDFSFGDNFWYQSAESLTKPTTLDTGNYSYEYKTAAAQSAMQEKIFVKIECTLPSTNYDWTLSLYGDMTVFNKGIGKDYTFALAVDCKF